MRMNIRCGLENGYISDRWVRASCFEGDGGNIYRALPASEPPVRLAKPSAVSRVS